MASRSFQTWRQPGRSIRGQRAGLSSNAVLDTPSTAYQAPPEPAKSSSAIRQFIGLVDEVINWRLFHFPRTSICIVARKRKTMPILVIQFRVIGPVIISRPTRFLSEQRVLHYAFGRQGAVLQFPASLQLM